MNTLERKPSGVLLLALVLAAVAGLALLCLDADIAQTAEDEVATVIAKIKRAHEGDEDGSLPDALAQAVELHNASEEPAIRSKIQGALGGLLKAKDAGSGRSAAAESLGKLGDPAGAYKVLKVALPRAKRAEVSPYQLRAVEAVGRLAPKAAVPDLAKLMKKGKAHPAVTAAIRALACYGKAGQVRVQVLSELLDAGVTWKAQAAAAEKKLATRKPPKEPKNPKKAKKAKKAPKPRKGDVNAKESIAAWRSYAPVLLESLNKLTGASRPSVDAWLALQKEKKTKLADLFAAGS